MNIETIVYGDLNIATVFRSKLEFSHDINFFTTNKDPLQIGYMKRPKKHNVKKHFHNSFKREVFKTNEVIILKKGSFRIKFYTDENKFIKEIQINKDDILLIQNGAHELEMLSDCEFYEIKNGPYFSNKDKTHLK
tara:strand:+ start:198 stop:602 length:405 start_codon:yes stop_codon:yes gene_type:complete